MNKTTTLHINNIELEDVLFGARCLLDFIEMAHPDMPLIWSGDRKTRVVDLPHFKKSKQFIDAATRQENPVLTFCAGQPGAMQRTDPCPCRSRLGLQGNKGELSFR